MRKRWKILIMILAIVIIAISFLITLSINLSSHKIPLETRQYYAYFFLTILSIGIIINIAIWTKIANSVKKKLKTLITKIIKSFSIQPKSNSEETLQKAIDNESEKDLMSCLDYRLSNTITPCQYQLIEKALVGTWHSQHEDLVNTIYLENLRDDRFIDPIMQIALQPEVYRWYDDELEATLRKCVHVLLMINSNKSREAIAVLKEMNNDNVNHILEM